MIMGNNYVHNLSVIILMDSFVPAYMLCIVNLIIIKHACTYAYFINSHYYLLSMTSSIYIPNLYTTHGSTIGYSKEPSCQKVSSYSIPS